MLVSFRRVTCVPVVPIADLAGGAIIVRVGTGARAVPADDDDVAVHPDHVDVRAIQGAEARRGEHGVGGPAAQRPAAT